MEVQQLGQNHPNICCPYGVESLPSYILTDEEGLVRARWKHYL
jgi:hypothetical protein